MWWITKGTFPPPFSIGNHIKYLNYQSLHAMHNSTYHKRDCHTLTARFKTAWIASMWWIIFRHKSSLVKNLVDSVHCFSGVLTNNGPVGDGLEIISIMYRIISTNLLFRIECAHIPGKHLYVIHKLHAWMMWHDVSICSFIIPATSCSKTAATGCWKHQDLRY